MDKLKPCPFCGGEARFDGMEMEVQCCTPGCAGQIWMFDTGDEAIAAWNTRALPPHADMVEKVARAIADTTDWDGNRMGDQHDDSEIRDAALAAIAAIAEDK